MTGQSPGGPPFAGARCALVLLFVINLFNYLDRQEPADGQWRYGGQSEVFESEEK